MGRIRFSNGTGREGGPAVRTDARDEPRMLGASGRRTAMLARAFERSGGRGSRAGTGPISAAEAALEPGRPVPVVAGGFRPPRRTAGELVGDALAVGADLARMEGGSFRNSARSLRLRHGASLAAPGAAR